MLNLQGNHLQTKGIKLIAKTLENISSLETLEIGYNNCTGEASFYLAYALSSNITSS